MKIRHFVADPSEPSEVAAFRQRQAHMLRCEIRRLIDDRSVSDVDFAYSLHLFTYGQAKDLCALALEIRNEGQA